MKNLTIDQIDDLLPQTQCGLCEFDGCRPYATAIKEKKEAIDRCPPGGVETLLALAELLNINPEPFIEDVREKAKPSTKAVIREDECIGCTKCIQACPTDAILGTGKLMHTVITDACTGCELCIEPCPVDCIDMVATKKPSSIKKNMWRTRYENRNKRLITLQQTKETGLKIESLTDRKANIALAIARAKTKKTG